MLQSSNTKLNTYVQNSKTPTRRPTTKRQSSIGTPNTSSIYAQSRENTVRKATTRKTLTNKHSRMDESNQYDTENQPSIIMTKPTTKSFVGNKISAQQSFHENTFGEEVSNTIHRQSRADRISKSKHKKQQSGHPVTVSSVVNDSMMNRSPESPAKLSVQPSQQIVSPSQDRSQCDNMNDIPPIMGELNQSPTPFEKIDINDQPESTPFNPAAELDEEARQLQEKSAQVIELQGQLRDLSQNLQNNQENDKINQELKNEFHQVVDQRNNSRKVLENASKTIQGYQEQHLKDSTTLLGENQTLNLQALVSDTQMKKSEIQLKQKEAESYQKSMRIASLKMQIKDLLQFKQQALSEQQRKDKLNCRHVLLKQQISELKEQQEKELNVIVEHKNELLQQKTEHEEKLKELDTETEKLQEVINTKQAEFEQKDALLSQYDEESERFNQIVEENQDLHDRLIQVKSERDEFSAQIAAQAEQNKKDQIEMINEFNQLIESKRQLHKNINLIQEDRTNKDHEIKTLTQENLIINGKVTQLQQLLCAQEDREAYVSEINDTVKSIDQVKEEIRQQHLECKQEEHDVNLKYKQAKTTTKNLIKYLQIRSEEAENLQQMIQELQETREAEPFLYVPVRDDPIDCKLANFLNRKPWRVRSRILFERESQGIYKYFKKRVFMKLEQDQIIIRVGGGYLTIDEFIETYCNAEEELQRRRLQNMLYGCQSQAVNRLSSPMKKESHHANCSPKKD